MNEKTSFGNQLVKYVNTAVGRDKINRTLQYTFRFFLAYNIKYNGSEETIAWLRNVVKNIQLSRQFVRTGRPLEHLFTFYKSLSLKDDLSKYCILCRNLSYAIYLSLDMMIWLHKAGIFKYDNIKTISFNSQIFWLLGITFGIIREIYILIKIAEDISEIRIVSLKEKKEKDKDIEIRKRRMDDLKYLYNKKKNHYLTLTQHTCDFLHPTTRLGIFHVEPIFLAIFGIISSLIGARTQWIKVNGK